MNIDFKYALGSNSLLATHLRIFSQGQAIVLKMAPLFPFSVEKKKADSLNLWISQSRQCWQDVIAASIERKGNASVVLKFFKKLSCDLKLVILDKQFAPEW